jgi:hypothetical protein
MQRSIDVRPPAVPGRGTNNVNNSLPQSDPELLKPMPRRSVKKSHGLITLVVVGLVVLLAATIGGLYVFGPGRSQDGVTVTVDGPTAVTSGDEVTYSITITNTDVALDVADLTLEYPVGFLIASVNPPATNAAGQSLFDLAPLPAREHVTVTVTGRLLGSVGTAAELRARLDYEPVNFSSSFRVDGTAITSIAASRVRLTFDAPTTAVSPDQIELSVSVENMADLTLNGVEVVLEVPEGVTITSSTPPLASSVGEFRFDLGTLEPGSSWHAQVGADIVGDGGSRRGLAVAVYQRSGGQRVIIERALREVEVVQPTAAVALVVNQSTSTSATAAAGSIVPMTVLFRNTGTAPLENLSLRLRLVGSVDWDRLTLASGQRDGESIIWNSSSPDAGNTLSLLSIDAAGAVAIDVPIRADAAVGEVVQAVAVLTSAAYGEDWQATAGPIAITIQ